MKHFKLKKKYLIITFSIIFLFIIMIINVEFIVNHFNFLSSQKVLNLIFGVLFIFLFILFNHTYQKRMKHKRKLKKLKKKLKVTQI